MLDTLDKSGKDAYNNISMMEAVHRVPEHLFVRGDEPTFIHFAPVHR